MTTFSTQLGTIAPGLLASDQITGAFSGLSSTASNQVLVSTGTDGYVFMPATNVPSPKQSQGIISFTLVNLGGAAFPSQTLTTVGGSTSNYDSSAQVMTAQFFPICNTSTFDLEYCYTAQAQNKVITVNLYAFPTLLPTPQATASVYNNQASNMAASAVGGITTGPIPFTESISVSLCAFISSSGGTQTGGGVFDYIIMKELSGGVPADLTASVTITNATPTLLLTVDPTNGNPGIASNVWIYGSVLYSDQANFISNEQTIMLLCEYNGTTSTFVAGSGSALAPNPFLTYAVVGTSVEISVTGAAAETFEVTMTYQQLIGGI